MDNTTRERAELDLLTDEGFSFSITTTSEPSRWAKLLGKAKASEHTTTYHIKPPTLGTLLRLARLGIELQAVDTEGATDADVFSLSWQSVLNNTELMASAVAVAVLGSQYKSKRVAVGLAQTFLETLTAKELLQIVQQLYISCNLADFISSTLLVQTSRPTEGGRVESKD